MDEFGTYLESTGSMETYRQKTVACFCNVFAELLQLEGSMGVALAGIIFPTSNRNVPTKEYFVCTPETLFNFSPSTGKTSSGGVMVELEDWSNNAIFPDGEYKTVQDVVTRLNVAYTKNTPQKTVCCSYLQIVLE